MGEAKTSVRAGKKSVKFFERVRSLARRLDTSSYRRSTCLSAQVGVTGQLQERERNPPCQAKRQTLVASPPSPLGSASGLVKGL